MNGSKTGGGPLHCCPQFKTIPYRLTPTGGGESSCEFFRQKVCGTVCDSAVWVCGVITCGCAGRALVICACVWALWGVCADTAVRVPGVGFEAVHSEQSRRRVSRLPMLWGKSPNAWAARVWRQPPTLKAPDRARHSPPPTARLFEESGFYRSTFGASFLGSSPFL